MSIFFTTNEGQENYILHSSPQSNKKRVIVHWGALNLFNASLFHPPQGPVKFSVFCKELGCFSTIQNSFANYPREGGTQLFFFGCFTTGVVRVKKGKVCAYFQLGTIKESGALLTG